MVQSKLGTKNLKLFPEGNALCVNVFVYKLVWNTEHSKKNMEELDKEGSTGKRDKDRTSGKVQLEETSTQVGPGAPSTARSSCQSTCGGMRMLHLPLPWARPPRQGQPRSVIKQSLRVKPYHVNPAFGQVASAPAI